MKRKRLVPIFVFLVAAIVLLAAFWNSIIIRVAPKMVLSKAIGEAFSALDTRFAGSPIRLLTQALDPQGREEVSFRLDTSNDLLGVLRYDMVIRTQGEPAKVLAQGNVITGGRKLDLSVYLDQNFAAVSSQSLVEENYYGITYDTFSADIRRNEFLAYLIGEETIGQWEKSISALQDTMSRSYIMPRITAEDIRTALYGVLVLKPQVQTETIQIAGADQKVHCVSFRASGKEIAEVVEPYWAQLPPELQELLHEMQHDPESEISAEFFLIDGHIIRIRAKLETGSGSTQITADLGKAPETEPLSLEFMSTEEESLERYTVLIDNSFDTDFYNEKLDMIRVVNGVQTRTALEYGWDIDTGELKLTVCRNADKTTLRMNLQPSDGGFALTSEDFYALTGIFTGKERDKTGICTMVVRRGDSIETPSYQNFDQWSMEDMLSLLGGLGGLLGLKMP